MSNKKKDIVQQPKLYIVIPCYNEEEVLPVTAPMFLAKINDLIRQGKISEESRILFVNDGSRDRTYEIIEELADQNEKYMGISLSRNRGHQNALLAGLMEVKDLCDISISIDCDGQDDINAMDQMVEEYLKGAEIVYGVRDNRDTDTFFKRFTAQTYYKLLNWLGADIVYNHADYRLLSARVLKELEHYKEVNLFLRGLVTLIGFDTAKVFYKREERLAGESHYPLSKMVSLAVDGITSLSIKPLRMITKLGMILSGLSFLLLILAIIFTLTGSWSSLWIGMAGLFLVMGLMILSLGVVGEYVGKTYMEVKERPRFIISKRTED